MRERMVSDFDRGPRFFGRFTWKDLLRLGIPLICIAGSGLTVGSSPYSMLPVYGLGLVVGIVWSRWRPLDDPVDVNLYHLLRWIVLRVVKL